MGRAARAGSLGLLTILLTSLLAGAALGADPGDPTSCPGVIATGPASYRLTADLDDCWVTRSYDQPPISIDLGGHTWSNSFVMLTQGSNRLTNGTFDASTVWISGLLDHVTMRNGQDFSLEAFGILTVWYSNFDSNQIALSAYFGSAMVEDCHFRGNVLGVVIGKGSGSLVERSTFRDNGTGVLLQDEDLYGSDDVTVRHNRFVRNGVGVEVDALVGVARARIEGNQVDESQGAGILVTAYCFSGSPCGGQGDVVERNHVRRNGFAAATPGDGDGIRVRVEGDRGEPLDVDPTWITLSGNYADRNADLGIDAPGVTDGGKNRAKFNGDPRQCVGVDCGVPAWTHAARRNGETWAGTQVAAQPTAQSAGAADPLARLLVLPRH